MQQLELFAQPTPTPQYKADDWVKTKRKPAIAAHIKRGEIFQVSAVHPISGCIKFHNPHINEWDFLYPDEVKSCPTPTNVESVVEQISEITVESVVEQISEVTVESVVEQISEVTVESVVEQIPEITVESVVEQISEITVESVVEQISEITVESVVEQIPEITVESVVEQIPEITVESVVEQISEVTVESVVKQISEVTVESVVEQISKITVESVVEPKNYWNSDGYSSNGFLESHYKIRVGGKQRSINCPEMGCTGPYSSYRWREDKKQRAKYVPNNKCPAVRRALKMGQPTDEILKIISEQ